MAQGKQSDQKMKPYLVYEYLMRYSDANHGGAVNVIEWQFQIKQGTTRVSTQVFAYGEDTRALRLVSKLPDLRAGYVNWILLRRTHFKLRVSPPKERKKDTTRVSFFLWRRHPDLNWG